MHKLEIVSAAAYSGGAGASSAAPTEKRRRSGTAAAAQTVGRTPPPWQSKRKLAPSFRGAPAAQRGACVREGQEPAAVSCIQ